MKKSMLAILCIFLLAAVLGHCRRANATEALPLVEGKIFHLDFGNEIVFEREMYTRHLKLLNIATEKDIVYIHMANFGGSVWTGALLFNAIKLSKAKVITIVEAPSFSMGALLACAGDEIQFQPFSLLMFHTYSASVHGKGNEIKEQVLAFDRLTANMMQECVRFGILSKQDILNIQNGQDKYVFPQDIK